MKLNLKLKTRIAEQKASEIIKEFGIYHPSHIRLHDIAFALGVQIKEGSLRGAAARLIRIGNRAVIRIPQTETNAPRRRFSIAHELGHFVLAHEGMALEIVCTEKDMMNWYDMDKETEANYFASELLMPEVLVKQRCDVKEVSFEPVKKIATDFDTSLTSAAIRFVKFCPEPCALICSEDAKIKWFVKSEEWWPFIRKGQKLDKRTLAIEYFIGQEIPDEGQEMNADVWLDDPKVSNIFEHSFAMKQYGLVLTLLWIT
ncbi:MAG: ImmA/IrrE family metallo-endopeptidase [Deltaproteobacteria bacterium]